jgi:hypothetical protein
MEPVPLVHASVGCVVVAYVVRCRMLVPYLLGLCSLLVFFFPYALWIRSMIL